MHARNTNSSVSGATTTLRRTCRRGRPRSAGAPARKAHAAHLCAAAAPLAACPARHARAHTVWPVLSQLVQAVRAGQRLRSSRACAREGGACRARLQAGKAEQGGPRGARARRPREQQQRAGEQGGRQRQRRRARGGQAARAQAQQLQRRRARARALHGRAQLLSQGALSGRARQVQALPLRRTSALRCLQRGATLLRFARPQQAGDDIPEAHLAAGCALAGQAATRIWSHTANDGGRLP